MKRPTPIRNFWFHHFQTQLSPEYGRNLPHIRSRHWLAQWNCWSPIPGRHGEQGRQRRPTPKMMQNFSHWPSEYMSIYIYMCIILILLCDTVRWRTSATLPVRIVMSFDLWCDDYRIPPTKPISQSEVIAIFAQTVFTVAGWGPVAGWGIGSWKQNGNGTTWSCPSLFFRVQKSESKAEDNMQIYRQMYEG